MGALRDDEAELEREAVFDIVIVGSGYGAGVLAARLSANRKRSICVLERGREYALGDFPTRFAQVAKETQIHSAATSLGSPLGLIDVRVDRELSVVVGCGLGGTSLINANVIIQPSTRVFAQDMWPRAIRDNPAVLDPYFGRAREILRPRQVPTARPKLRVLEKSAKLCDAKFYPAEISVAFDRYENQKACVECGNCVTGCNYAAKNTLCYTYLPIAKRNGVKLYTQCAVGRIERAGDEWLVHYRHIIDGDRSEARQLRARAVVLGAGSLGSTEILLRSRDAGLPLSDRLGLQFSGNGDSLAFGYDMPEELDSVGFGKRRRTDHLVGPTITGVVDLRSDSGDLAKSIIIEDGAFPGGLAVFLRYAIQIAAAENNKAAKVPPLGWLQKRWRELLDWIGLGHLDGALNHTQLYLIIGHDGAGGTLRLDANGRLEVHWPGMKSLPVFAEASRWTEMLSKAVGGDHVLSPAATRLDSFVTVHPLGGCAMGDDTSTAVVDDLGRVFDGSGGVHRGLYVVDGAIVPTSVGVNPLWTISALAERIAEAAARELA